MDTKLKTYAVGVDMGGTHIRIGAVTCEGTLHFFEKRKTKDVVDSQNPVESLSRFLSEYLHQLDGEVIGVGLGFPSVVSKDKKRIYTTPTMAALGDINIVDPLEASLNIPVYINNDVNHLLQYEISKREIAEDEIVLGFYIGTGYGNAIYMRNDFLEGKHGAAGELGHIPVYHADGLCNCGNVGCIETVASGKRLLELYEAYFSDVPFEDIFSKYANHPVIDDFIKAVSMPIATEINIFDPHLVIIGGGVIGMKDFPRHLLVEKIIASCRKPVPAEGLVLEFAEDIHAAGVLGAASHIYEKMSKVTKV
ncbi:allose kinase [Pseudogracilibacillus auburnensis]|uniref:allose kinase n=1 Tax=Pseudogracilibacillus auburnensis TaxID=1494959 RepID=UPI001A968AF5|nr:allose kinase [Pseudogracilibacillus auburnensis]MBO1005116.1 allose kinase [Pseudogracilibacillus auburnensis]